MTCLGLLWYYLETLKMTRRYRARAGNTWKIVGNYIPAPTRLNVCGHLDRPHSGKGMCRSCYKLYQYKIRPELRQAAVEGAKNWRDRNRARYHISQGKPRKVRGDKRHLERKFGITVEQYETLFHQQNGTCAICLSAPTLERRLAVDHCHKTKIIRGLLCFSCNSALGHFKDDPNILRKAAVYLEQQA